VGSIRTVDKTLRYKITRRQFINGIAVSAGATLLAPFGSRSGAAIEPSDYYPPTLTGLRGNHPGSYEVSHAFA